MVKKLFHFFDKIGSKTPRGGPIKNLHIYHLSSQDRKSDIQENCETLNHTNQFREPQEDISSRNQDASRSYQTPITEKKIIVGKKHKICQMTVQRGIC